MKIGELPRQVRRFLDSRVEGVEQLEILILLHQYPDRSWNAAGVADAVRLSPRTAERHLEALVQQHLLDVRLGGDVLYRYSPATDGLADLVRQVAEAYREQRGLVLAAVTARRLRALQDFSDAFRLGEDNDG